MKLDFKPEVFLEATNVLVKEDFACFCIFSGEEFTEEDYGNKWDDHGTYGRGFFEKLFGVPTDKSRYTFEWMLKDLGYKESSDEEMKYLRFMCLYLAYLVAKDIEAGEIDMEFDNA